jgi:hypothetical protein
MYKKTLSLTKCNVTAAYVLSIGKQINHEQSHSHSLDRLLEGHNCFWEINHCLLLISFGKSLFKPYTV